MGITGSDRRAALPDRSWAIGAGVVGILCALSYGLVVALPTSPQVSVLLVSLFALGFAGSSIALHLGVTSAVAPRLGLLAAVANTAAAVELLAMALVQIAVKDVAPHPGHAMTAIWLGLDVAWDVFGAVGTVLFGLALWYHARFRPVLALGGVAVGALLLALNIATFPTPPAEAGSFDAGPLVALWYVLLFARVLLLVREQSRRALPADDPQEQPAAEPGPALVE